MRNDIAWHEDCKLYRQMFKTKEHITGRVINYKQFNGRDRLLL